MDSSPMRFPGRATAMGLLNSEPTPVARFASAGAPRRRSAALRSAPRAVVAAGAAGVRCSMSGYSVSCVRRRYSMRIVGALVLNSAKEDGSFRVSTEYSSDQTHRLQKLLYHLVVLHLFSIDECEEAEIDRDLGHSVTLLLLPAIHGAHRLDKCGDELGHDR